MRGANRATKHAKSGCSAGQSRSLRRKTDSGSRDMLSLRWKLLELVSKSRLLVDHSRELLATSRQLIEGSHARRVPNKMAWSRHLQRERDLPKKAA